MKNYLPAIEGGKPQRKNFLIFGKPQIWNPEIREVVNSLKSGWIGTGPKTTKFEELIRNYLGVKYALALNSCTAGLHLSLMACGIGREDEVITTPMTFASTANVIEHVGAKPVFADIEIDSMNIDPVQIERKISRKTKCIIPVHIAGRPCQMDKIMNIAKKYKLKVIEDAAHAFGAIYKGKKIGTIGDITTFSFYVTKNLITGEGGMISTNNKQYAEFTQLYALHGMSKGAWRRYADETFRHYLIQAPGYKYNMMDLQAALGIHQFRRFETNQKKRAKLWEMYNKAFSDLPVILPMPTEKGVTHAYHLYTILLDLPRLKVDRDMILAAIHAENIGVGVHFISLHLHPYYRNKYKYKYGDFPNSEYISDRTISIPFSAQVSEEEASDVIAAVRKVILYYTR